MDVARRAGIIVVCAATMSMSVVACSGTRSVSAIKLCQPALPGQDVVSSQLATVAEVRALGAGLDHRTKLAPSAFPSATGGTAAAWCWTSQGGSDWTAYAAGPHKSAVKLMTLGGVTATPSGPPNLH
ncbi:MAG: hypothetical protein M3N95_16645 [Actinomycetota bacterium]|nr:hypothetical protein [Actinomycetota bacterium]